MSDENSASSNTDLTILATAMAKLAHLIEDEDEGKKKKSKTDWMKLEPEIEHLGKKVILPAEPSKMSTEDGIKVLERKLADERTVLDVHEQIECFPLEGGVAFVQALHRLYGWASPVPTPSFWGPQAPDFLSIQTDVDEWVQVPWGSFKVPGIENRIQISAGNGCIVLSGEVRKKEKTVLLEIAAETRKILREQSIYRGKAIRIKTNAKGGLDMHNPPEFIDLRGVNPEDIILNADVHRKISHYIWGPLRFTDHCRQWRTSLKRGNLLYGGYGTGKTMTARATGKIAIDNGWTFIMVDRPESLKEALVFARRYQPAVVFCEDIDRGMNERTDKANDLLNVVSGVVGNKDEIMVIFTTNFVEKIDQAMLRPGRLDGVIEMSAPDAEAVKRFVELYGRRRLAKGENLDKFGEQMLGQSPASIAEAVEKAKLISIFEGRDTFTQDNLLAAAEDMRAHLKLLEPKEKPLSTDENLGVALRTSMAHVLGQNVPNTENTTKVDPNGKTVAASMIEALDALRKIQARVGAN